MIASIAWQLGRRTEIHVPRDAWQPEALPDWLRMNFKVVDEAGKPIEMGRDLDEIRRKLRIEVKETFASLPQSRVASRRHHALGFSATCPSRWRSAGPASHFAGSPLWWTRRKRLAAAHGHARRRRRPPRAAGLRRLFILQLGEQMKYLARNLPGIDAMCLHYATIGPCADLRRDLLQVITDRALFGDDDARPGADPQARRVRRPGRDRLAPPGAATAEVAASSAKSSRLPGHRPAAVGLIPAAAVAPAVPTCAQQLAHLLPRGFVVSTPLRLAAAVPPLPQGDGGPRCGS